MIKMVEKKVSVRWKDNEQLIPLYYIEKEEQDSDILVVYLHGAANKPLFPYYNGRSISTKCKANFILFSDPMRFLDEKCQIAWFTSPWREEEIIKTMSDVVNQYVVDNSIKDVLIISGSAGGMPAIRLSYAVKQNTSVLLHNPQTDLLKYSHPRFGYSSGSCWYQISKWDSSPKANTNILDSKWFDDKPNNKYYILQMASDVSHVVNHFTPLISVFDQPLDEVAYFFSRWVGVNKNVLLHLGTWTNLSNILATGGHYQLTSVPHIQFINDFISGKRDFDTDYFREWDIKT